MGECCRGRMRGQQARSEVEPRRSQTNKNSNSRAAILNASDERTPRARIQSCRKSNLQQAKRLEHSANPKQIRKAFLVQSMVPRQARVRQFAHSVGLERARAAICSTMRSRSKLKYPFRNICGSGRSSSGVRQIAAPYLEPRRATKLCSMVRHARPQVHSKRYA